MAGKVAIGPGGKAGINASGKASASDCSECCDPCADCGGTCNDDPGFPTTNTALYTVSQEQLAELEAIDCADTMAAPDADLIMSQSGPCSSNPEWNTFGSAAGDQAGGANQFLYWGTILFNPSGYPFNNCYILIIRAVDTNLGSPHAIWVGTKGGTGPEGTYTRDANTCYLAHCSTVPDTITVTKTP